MARYETLQVQECWSFDRTDGGVFSDGLAGWRLVGGRYWPIPIQRDAKGNKWGYSTALGLDVCWEEGQLRFREPESGRYLRTHEEENQRAGAAEQRANAEQQRADAAEQRVNAEQQRAGAAEQENAQLRERLAELGMTLD